jgi:hypothetical protein
MAYPSARIVSTRHDKLPTWLLQAWEDYCAEQGEEEYEADDSDETSPDNE